VAAGLEHSLVLCADGTTTAWGEYQKGRTGQWFPMTPGGCCGAVSIGSGMSHCLMVISPVGGSGTVFAWGDDTAGQTDVPSGLTDAVAVDGGDYHSLALRVDGTVVAWGDNYFGQTNVPSDLHNAIAIAAGGEHNLALIGPSPPSLHSLLLNPSFSNGTFTVSIPSQSGRLYALEYKDSLGENLWKTLPLTAGNGRILTMIDASSTRGTRYYRVRRW
jgi:alpha-tubulin suppressor-like RCC1 family protein